MAVEKLGGPPPRSPRSLSIGIVTEHYYPVLGGVSENVHHTARELIARGHRVRIITPAVSGGRSSHLPTPDGIPVTNVGRAITLYGNGAQSNAAIGMHLLRDLGDVLRATTSTYCSSIRP
jgi:phosphatidylinositol alpha-mannosyltransferase